jgi:hypothetical protein
MSHRESEATPPAPPAAHGRGGRRPGAGRPRNGRFSPLQGDREYARELISKLMRHAAQPAALRARCALVVVTRGNPINYRPDVSVAAQPAAQPSP